MDQLGGRMLGPYELQERLGAGGMGVVYRAVHRRLRQPRALKVLPEHLAANPEFVERFEREARLAAELRHSNIVGVHDVGDHDGTHYIAMELLEGRPLRQVIREDAPLPLDRAARLLRQLAEALDFAHAHGVAHRDVKPGNVFVRQDDHLTLVDFGIAHAASEARLTGTGAIVGTAEYLAPEVIMGAEHGTGSDLYAFGIVAYELMTGRLPFTGANSQVIMFAQVNQPPPRPTAARPDLPSVVEGLLLRQLAKLPEQRFSPALAFVAALEAGLTWAEERERLARSVPEPAPPPRAETDPILRDDLSRPSQAGGRVPATGPTQTEEDALRARTWIAPAPAPPPTRVLHDGRPPPVDAEAGERFPRRQVLIALAAVVATGGGLLVYSLQVPEREQGAGPAPKPSAPAVGTSATVPTAVVVGPTGATAPSPSPAAPTTVVSSTLLHTIVTGTTFDAGIGAFDLTADGQMLVVGNSTGPISVWRIADRTRQRSWEGRGRIDCLAISPDGNVVATGTGGHDVDLWQIGDGRQLHRLAGHRDGVTGLAFSPDGQVVASAAFDASVRLWRVADGSLLTTLQNPGRSGGVVAFSPDGNTIAMGGFTSGSLWRGPEWQRTHDLAGDPSAGVNAIEFSPDGKLVAAGWSDDAVRVYRADDGSLLHTLVDPSRYPGIHIEGLAFTPDGGFVIAGRGGVRQVNIWSAADGKPAGRIAPDKATELVGIAFSPVNSLLAVAGRRDGDTRFVELWQVTRAGAPAPSPAVP